MTILTASLANVQIGTLTIEGLMFEDGSFGVAVPQIATQFGIDTNTASRDFKRLLGEGFRPSKTKVEGSNERWNSVQLKDYELIVAKLDRKGNITAQDFRDSLVGLSLHQLFCDAFDLKCDSDDRQSFLKARQEGKVTRRAWTDAVKDYIYRHNNDAHCTYKYRQYIYSNSTNYLNRKVLGHSARNAKILFQIEQTDSLRDQLSERVLKELEHIENLAMRYVDDDDLDPLKAMKLACEVGKVKYIGLSGR